ncbi:MAG TPA: proline dehydrogenase family protein [Bacteroidia bacterium]|jgi:proline dehydrogenase|nr:proline dehydrogenase family protein [Bacteroidia bacterium]
MKTTIENVGNKNIIPTDNALRHTNVTLETNEFNLNKRDMININLHDTAYPFAGKSNRELRNSYWLFKLIGNNTLVEIGKAMVKLFPLRKIIKATIFKQFCGGENISECLKTVERLAKSNIGSILDFSSEGGKNEGDFDKTALEIICTIEVARNNKNIPFAVFKPSGVAGIPLLECVSLNTRLNSDEAEAWERAKNRIDRICHAASENNVQLLVDAEESWIQGAIDNLVHQMMEKYNGEKCLIFNTIQMYRKDRLEYLENELNIAKEKGYHLGIKLVRGAYMEKERNRAKAMGYGSPINETKADTDYMYDRALEFCVHNLNYICLCAGTHNEASCIMLANLLREKKIPPGDPQVYFSQLLGMSDNISYNLAKEGYMVAKYVPYGKVNDVLPYLIRRAHENTSVKGQIGRELSFIIKEMLRRKEVKKLVPSIKFS